MSAAFACPKCDLSFSKSSNLSRHIASVHDEVRRFVCTHAGCAKAFKRKRDLDGHVNSVHLQATPYACDAPGCTRAFARQEQLRVHKKTHAASAASAATSTIATATASTSHTLEAPTARVDRARCGAASTEDLHAAVSGTDDAPHADVLGVVADDALVRGAAVALLEVPRKRCVGDAMAVAAAPLGADVASDGNDVVKASKRPRAGTVPSSAPASTPALGLAAKSPRLPPVTQNLFKAAAEHSQLVKHDDHVDALIDGRLLSLDGLAEHDLAAVVEWCNLIGGDALHGGAEHHHDHESCARAHTAHDCESRHTHDGHQHRRGCGHVAVQHGEHVDFLVGNELHHDLGDGHCETHGFLNMCGTALLDDVDINAASWQELFAHRGD